MKLILFLLLPLITPIVAPTQIEAAVQPNSLTSTTLNTPNPSPILIAQQNRTRRIQFARGKNSSIIKNAVVRGTRDIYLVGAKRHQRMIVSISSLENNAVFDIIAPNRRSLKTEATTWSGVLPATGDYKIIVGGTRGNASYTMKVTIK